jgi:Xaa-Pro aminopeptidase
VVGDVLLYADTERSAALRHEIPLAIGDPFLFAEVSGRAAVLTSVLERDRLAATRPDAEIIGVEDVGFHELLRSGRPRHEIMAEMVSRAVSRLGVREATVPDDFPVAMADRLRSDGVVLVVDPVAVEARRRVKSPSELEGILLAQRAAEAGMAAAERLLASADVRDGELMADGAPLTAEQVRDALRAACAQAGAPAPPDVIVASVRQGFGHEPGSGPLPAGLPIQVDLWPREERTGCWADMTRTFVVGDVGEAVLGQEQLVRAALEEVRARVRPGVTGRELHGLVCDRFEAAGYRTQRTGPGEDPVEGFQFSLGHGVGLEVHEAPGLGMLGTEPFVAGDVLAVEPGLWDRTIGGVRYEDLLLVTADGCETLTRYPYDLRPRPGATPDAGPGA